MDWTMVADMILGIVIMGLIGFLIYGMYLLEKDKQDRWEELREKKLREAKAVVSLKKVIKELED